jgi:hypothetical protein
MAADHLRKEEFKDKLWRDILDQVVN